MAFTRCRQWLTALLVCAGMGLFAAAPLQAQQARAKLSTLRTQTMDGCVSCAQLPDCFVYLVSDGANSTPSFILLHPEQNPAPKREDVATLGKRFERAYALKSEYKMSVLGNGRSVMFTLEEKKKPRWKYRGEQALLALTNDKSLAPAIAWLNTAAGGVPEKFDGQRLIWRDETQAGRQQRDMGVSLNLFHGVPCYVDLRVRASSSQIAEAVSGSLRLSLEEISGSTANSLRRQVGAKPLGFMGGSYRQGGRQRKASICVIKPTRDNNLYRLADVSTLKRLDDPSESFEDKLTEIEPSQWADEDSSSRAGLAASAAASWEDDDDDWDSEADASTPGSTQAAAATAGPALSPAEARKAYAERLKSL